MNAQNTNKLILIVSLFASLSYGKEISVFGAGNLDSSTPYGLNKTEKAVLQNNEKVNELSLKIDALNLKVGSFESKQDEISQRIEGIKSIYESDSQNINTTKLKIKSSENKFEEQVGVLSVKISENSKRIEELSTKLDDFITSQKKNNKLLEDSILKLLTIMNKINGEYVKKVEFDELVAFINKNSAEQIVSVPPPQKKQENIIGEPIEKQKVDKKDNKDLFDEGLKLFKSNQMSKAMLIFEQLVESKYKPAESNFYFAETKFIKKEYKEAIQSYKQSMIANDKAEYIPKLLFHSAISFENLKQKENAINFYKTIIEVYPDSQEAKDAAKKMKSKEDIQDNKKETEKSSKKTTSKEKTSKDSKKDVKKTSKKTNKSSKDKETKIKKKDKE